MASETIRSPNLGRGLPPGQKYVRNYPINDITYARQPYEPEVRRFKTWAAIEEP